MYDLPADHSGFPRLFFTSDDLPRIRRKLDHADCRATWSRLLAACESMLGPAPTPVAIRHVGASHMAFASLVTGRSEFADRAIAMAMEIASRASWLMASEINVHRVRSGLGSGAAVRELTLVYDWLYARLTDEQRSSIREAVRTKGFEPTLQDIRENVPMTTRYTTNGMCVLNGPLLMAALCFEGQMETAEAYEAPLRQVRRYLDAQDPDGGYTEGLLYWNYSIRHLLLGVETLRRLKGIDLYHESFLQHTGDYALYGILPWLTQCESTADAKATTHLWSPIAALAARHRRPEWQWLARRMITHDWGQDGESLEYSLFYLLFYDPEVPSAVPPASNRLRLFSGIQQFAVRSDWTEDAVQVTWLNGPSNCHHNHLHLNSFTISAFGQRLLIEEGSFDYSNSQDYRRLTPGHNTLLMNGQGQAITTDTSISCLRVRAGQWGTVFGEFRALREEAGAVIATGVAVNAYPGRLRTFERTLAFVADRLVFFHDFIELEGDPPATLEWHFHSGGTIERASDRALFVAGDVRLRLVFLAAEPLALTERFAPPERCYPDRPVPCLDLTSSASARRFDLYGLLVPFRAGSEPVPHLEFRAGGASFDVDGATWHYDWQRRKLFRPGETFDTRVV